VIAWPRRGRLWLLVGQVACLATVVLAGRASAERATSSGQAVWLVVAVAAALVSAAGNGVWLAVLRRAANSRRQLVFARLTTHAGPPEADTAAAADEAAAWVMIPGLTLRHRPDCALVTGKRVVPASADAEPCGWCSP
jgi:hypothetical protein